MLIPCTCTVLWLHLKLTFLPLLQHGKVQIARRVNCLAHISLSEINLSELQKTLDVQGEELVDSQKESLVGRKALAEKTKG